jgi:uncharacterized protein YndB with AHSA1/START domain
MSNGSAYVYVTYIRTDRQRLWSALTDRQAMKQYWFGMEQESEWKPGSSWKMIFPDGRVADAGEIVEMDPPNRLVIKWRNEFRPELKVEGFSLCAYELEQAGEAVKLTITHTINRDDSQFIGAVANGWPQVLSNLKSWLETGEVAMQNTIKK